MSSESKGSSSDQTVSPSPQSREVTRRLLTILHRRGEDGEYQYADEDIKKLLPWLLLPLLANKEVALSEDILVFLGQFIQKHQLTSSTTQEEFHRGIVRAFEADSPSAAIMLELGDLIREYLAQGADPDTAKRLAEMLGTAHEQPPKPGKRPPPVGGVAAGPMARFQLMKDLVKK